MQRPALVPLLALTLSACGGEPGKSGEPAKSAEASPAPTTAPVEAKVEAQAKPDADEPTSVDPIPSTPEPEEPTTADPVEDPDAEGVPEPVPEEIAIKPWTALARTQAWTPVAAPSNPLTLIDLHAGVLAKAGTSWLQLGEDGALAAVEMDVEPKLPLLGVWPSDAWFIDERMRKDDDDPEQEHVELRLMKLRGGNRWVPQTYAAVGEQWFDPRIDDQQRLEPRISTRSGMLVIASFGDITRVAGKHGDPSIGSHRGEGVGFVENGAGKTYVLSKDADGYYAQIQCEDEPCVATSAKKLPLTAWTFARQVARGRHNVSVAATSGAREFVLHYGGKREGWVLDELPPGEAPTGMWASGEGGLWTRTGEHLRWRDTESVWHEVALPEGLTGLSVAVTEDRKQLVVAGLVDGSAKVFSSPANPAD